MIICTGLIAFEAGQWRRSSREQRHTHSTGRMLVGRILSMPTHPLSGTCDTDGDLGDASFAAHALFMSAPILTAIEL
ncbi:hypothetical protein T265_00445 [Opisthorchis viverrini]|uniref:Uncharacterized protein n=1 Tax=Opisthorchis viverrini TaxID=6198 RepID=A0A075A235_OPIVI|nr:hypothetical protein T265_00445 [Opisthorchis viverrini]KER33768.1 hypothetical protein T265_00445 [Opisthorchis viverrini]